MRFQIRGTNVKVDNPLRTLVEKRLRFALGRFEPRIRQITVALTEINGPRGGVDNSCRITVHLNHGRTVRVHVTGPKRIPLVGLAADHVGYAILRARERRCGRGRHRFYSSGANN